MFKKKSGQRENLKINKTIDSIQLPKKENLDNFDDNFIRQEVQKIFKTYDSSKKGQLSRDDFILCYSELSQKFEGIQELDDYQIDQLFEIIDDQDNGYVTQLQIFAILIEQRDKLIHQFQYITGASLIGSALTISCQIF